MAAWALCFFTLPARGADEVTPDVLVRNVTTEVLDLVRKDKDIQSGNTRKTLDLVNTRILPHFNFSRMTMLAMGRESRKASPEQMKVLTEEFRDLLVRTYSKALSEFRDQEIGYRPFKMAANDTEVRVQTEIKKAGGNNITLDYYLEKSAVGWKVYDMEVAGVSLVTNYREQFSSIIRTDGVDGLIRALQAKNKKAPVA
jgi:phospholipid transport system substrate-binding protein